MAISHVIRGEDHLSNTPKYQLLWQALGYGPLPVFAHLPLLVNEKRQKLSKRRDKVALEDYRDEGYLPEAMRGLPGPARLVARWRPRGPVAGRADRRVPPRGRQERPGLLRREEAAGDQRGLHPRPQHGRVHRAVPGLAAGALGPDRPVGAGAGPGARRCARTWSTSSWSTDVVIDDQDWEKGVRQQPAFAALLTGAISAFETCAWDAETLKGVVVEVGAGAGVPQLGKAQAPIRLGHNRPPRRSAVVRVAGAARPGPDAAPAPGRPGQARGWSGAIGVTGRRAGWSARRRPRLGRAVPGLHLRRGLAGVATGPSPPGAGDRRPRRRPVQRPPVAGAAGPLGPRLRPVAGEAGSDRGGHRRAGARRSLHRGHRLGQLPREQGRARRRRAPGDAAAATRGSPSPRRPPS